MATALATDIRKARHDMAGQEIGLQQSVSNQMATSTAA
jgi:hypothetical protein